MVLVGDKGLTEAVLKEIEVHLKSHELIKVRAATADRDEREAMLRSICDELNAQAVQHIGKMLVIYRKKPAEPERAVRRPKPSRSSARARAKPALKRFSAGREAAAAPARAKPARKRFSAGREAAVAPARAKPARKRFSSEREAAAAPARAKPARKRFSAEREAAAAPARAKPARKRFSAGREAAAIPARVRARS